MKAFQFISLPRSFTLYTIDLKTNPPQLVRCLQYDPDSPAPYDVVIHPHALVVMDIHAHTSHAEVSATLFCLVKQAYKMKYLTQIRRICLFVCE